MTPHRSEPATAPVNPAASAAHRDHEKLPAPGSQKGTPGRDWLDAEADVGIVVSLMRKVARLEAEIAEQRTARAELERRLATEHAIGQILEHVSALADAAPEVLRIICECLAWDAGVFWRYDDRTRSLRCVDVWHAPSVEIPVFLQVSRGVQFPVGIGLPGRVWASQTLHWISDATTDANFPRASIAAREGLRGAVGFPILGEHECLGVMEFFSREILAPDAALIAMMSSIGGRISQFIAHRGAEDELCRQAEDRRLAREIQQDLLPKQRPYAPGLDIAGGVVSANDVGGDCFDVLPMTLDQRQVLGLLVADASGHGLAAALLMAETIAYLRALALTSADAGTLLTLANRRLATELPPGTFLTALLIQLDLVGGSITYAGAGHPAGLILDKLGWPTEQLASTGTLLGIDPQSEFETRTARRLQSGELLLLYTDGLVDTFGDDGGAFGIDRVLAIVRGHRADSSAGIVDALFRGVTEFSGQSRHDDMTALVVKAE